MTVGFDITQADVKAFYEYHTTHDAYVQAVKRIKRLFMPSVLVLAGIWAFDVDYVILANILIAIAVIWAIFMPRLYIKGIIKIYKEMVMHPDNANFFIWRTMTFSSEGIKIECEVSDEMCKWQAFKKICETQDHFFLYQSTITALIVPKRILTADQVENLRSLFATYMQQQAPTEKN